jgi:hypothetical protein
MPDQTLEPSPNPARSQPSIFADASRTMTWVMTNAPASTMPTVLSAASWIGDA